VHLKRESELKSTWLGNPFQVFKTRSVKKVAIDRMQTLLWRLYSLYLRPRVTVQGFMIKNFMH